MPPAAAARRGAPNTSAGGDMANSANGTRRTTTSGRAIRTNTTRPTNYYARPYANQQDHDADESASHPTAFFPALTFFTDAVTALPKEVMRHFTLMKEVEAKIHGPSERLGEVVESLLRHPVPRRKDGIEAQQGGLLSLTAANSAMGSANVSLVNGVAPYGASGLNSTAGSTVEEESIQDAEEDLARRREYHELRMLTRDLLANVDEKNVVLTEANRVLGLQMMRLDSVMPHIDAEIPEESRLGSMTHWAYSDNRQKTKPVAPVANERNRRDVAATNSLAAAASAIHETEIATARREAAKEATRERHGKAKTREQLDSEFEERPKKAGPKTAKGKGAMAQTLTGLGISTISEPVKRRKVDKVALPLSMERQLSSTGRGKPARETPRSTPATETVKKSKAKAPPPPPPKRKGQASAQASPALASTPLHSSFSPAVMEPPGSRAQSARRRNNSTATNLRHEALADDERSRPTSAAGKQTKERTNGRKRTRDEAEEPAQPVNGDQTAKAPDSEMKREDVEHIQRPVASRSSSSNKASGRQSKVGTPRATEPQVPTSEAAMLRTRSTRSVRANGDTPSSEPPMQGRMHKRSAHGGSVSGLMKQIAPFNRSPDHNRGSGRDADDMDDDIDSPSGEEREARFTRNGRRSGTGSRAGSRAVSRHISMHKRSRHNTQDDQGQTGTDEDTDMPNATHDRSIVSTRENLSPAPAQQLTHSPSPGLSSRPGSPANQTPPPQQHGEQTTRSSPAPSSSPSPTPSHHSPAPPPRQSSRHTTSHPHQQQQQPNSPSPSPSASPSPEPEPELLQHDTREAATAASTSPSPDPDDPNEPKYCYCLRGSYGDMVGCDNPKCDREWFHLACTDLTRMPAEEESWFCTRCRPRGNGNGSGIRGRGGRGRGRGRGS